MDNMAQRSLEVTEEQGLRCSCSQPGFLRAPKPCPARWTPLQGTGLPVPLSLCRICCPGSQDFSLAIGN